VLLDTASIYNIKYKIEYYCQYYKNVQGHTKRKLKRDIIETYYLEVHLVS